MISYIKGKIIHRGANFIIVKSGEIGFKVFTLVSLDVSAEEIELYTYLKVREDDLSLYGFSKYEELELFEMLISVSGIGPKTGMGVLSLADAGSVKVAIARGDASVLTHVSGIGKKTAERIILELRNKFKVTDDSKLDAKSKEITDHADAVEALMGLGYSPSEAKKALSKVPPEVKDVGEKIRMALKELGKRK